MAAARVMGSTFCLGHLRFFRFWHETDLPSRVRHVRCQRMNRLILAVARGLSLTLNGHQNFATSNSKPAPINALS